MDTLDIAEIAANSRRIVANAMYVKGFTSLKVTDAAFRNWERAMSACLVRDLNAEAAESIPDWERKILIEMYPDWYAR